LIIYFYLKYMKIVIPTDGRKGLDERVADHFGRCQTYTFLNEQGEVIEIIDNASEHMGGHGLPPTLMKKYGADVLLCGSLGPRALDLCRELGIEVFVDEAQTVGDFFTKWKNNKLNKASSEDVCAEHKK
jgi:predicted Fe-Mo cluster-binding NifX family protein